MSRTWSASFLDQLEQYGALTEAPFGYHLRLADAATWRAVAQLLKTEGQVDYFLALTATHQPPAIHLRYDLRSLLSLTDIAVHFSVGESEAVPSVADIWAAAEWQEREAYDLVGVQFSGHPDLRRILLPADWEGHPLRCDYAMPSAYHEVPLIYQPPNAPV